MIKKEKSWQKSESFFKGQAGEKGNSEDEGRRRKMKKLFTSIHLKKQWKHQNK